ncbi:MAG: hypothetical protein LBK82_00820 [Planctomycetaceae bacterium]|jgi:hypothetical protein|nr:hypothetical protein [Planctomycetaceae bacterium]
MSFFDFIKCLFWAIIVFFVLAGSAFAQEAERGFQHYGMGWTPDPKATEEFVKTIPTIYGVQVEELIKLDTNEDALLYRALIPCLERYGVKNWTTARKQSDGHGGTETILVVKAYQQGGVGSCVGNATAACLSVLNAVEEFNKKEPQEFTAMHSADGMYGLMREAAGMLGGRDGGTGSGAAKAIQTLGSLYCVKYDAADLTVNNPDRARQFGRTGIGEKLKQEAKPRNVYSAVRVNNVQEAWSLIGNGYPINVCSGQGFSRTRDKDGVCKPSGSWSHSMAVVGRKTINNRKLFLIWNSWGDNWCSDPYVDDMPMGSFGVDFSVLDGMLKRSDSFAYSDLNGFPKRSPIVLDFGTKEYLGYIVSPVSNKP